MSEQIKSLPIELRATVKAIKTAILQSQYRAARMVNREQLSLYFSIGHYISEHSRKGYWGSGAIESISEQLQRELPGLKGFGASSLKNMRLFYEAWQDFVNRQPSADELEDSANCQPMADDLRKVKVPASATNETEKIEQTLLMVFRQPSSTELNLEDFVNISFSHHIEILSKATSLDERIFYIHQTALNKWDKYKLRKLLKADLYHHQGTMPNNFTSTISDTRTALQAIEMFKDEYLLDFINVEEIGARDAEDVDEREVENAIIQNVKNFIMTFGKDFTFVGNQYHLEKFGHHSYPDLLFYNRELAALVVVELKRGDFKPAYLGQLSAYLRILDSEVKKPFENPTIGIVLCKRADKSFVEFLIQGYDNPMGVAVYKSAEDVRKVLPTEEELRQVMDAEVPHEDESQSTDIK